LGFLTERRDGYFRNLGLKKNLLATARTVRKLKRIFKRKKITIRSSSLAGTWEKSREHFRSTQSRHNIL